MMISDQSFLHLHNAEEARLTEELERRRGQQERLQAENEVSAPADPEHGRSTGARWWAGAPHARRDAHRSEGTRAA